MGGINLVSVSVRFRFKWPADLKGVSSTGRKLREKRAISVSVRFQFGFGSSGLRILRGEFSRYSIAEKASSVSVRFRFSSGLGVGGR